MSCAVQTIAAVASYACLMATKAIVGGDLRVPEGAEQGEGLDMWCHGEACYTLSEGEIGGGQPAPELANNVTPPAPAPAPASA